MLEVSNAGRIVFPEIGRTKGDVVAYYERIAERALPHVVGRPLSIKRFPKGLAAPDAFVVDDLDRLLDRPDTLAELARSPNEAERFVAEVEAAFEASGLELETFDRFRS